MNKKQFLRALNDVYCRIAPVKHGVGVIAIRDIPQGIDPFKNCDAHGDTLAIPQKEFDAFDAPDEAKRLVRDFCALQDGVYYVPSYGIDAIDKSFFLNHSKKPNLITKDHGETFVAIRKIKKGEELCANYDTYDQDPHKRKITAAKKKRY
jgi:hypothetical protein